MQPSPIALLSTGGRRAKDVVARPGFVPPRSLGSGELMECNTSPLSKIELTSRQRDLQANLAKAIRRAIPAEIDLDKAQQRAQGCYRVIAELLVDLRHEFSGPDGEPYDLQGRSSAYRTAVREAYAQAGADIDRPIPKRLTAALPIGSEKSSSSATAKRRCTRAGSSDILPSKSTDTPTPTPGRRDCRGIPPFASTP